MRATNRRRWVRLGVLMVAIVALLAERAVLGQQVKNDPVPPKETSEPKLAKPSRIDMNLDQQINQAKEEIELLKAQLDAKKALCKIGEARLEQAKAWKAHFEGLFRAGKVTEDKLLASKDDLLMLEAHLAGEKADVKLAEMRVRQAQRRLDYGEFPMTPVENRLSEIDQRMSSMELKIDRLQHEVGRLRRDDAGASKIVPH